MTVEIKKTQGEYDTPLALFCLNFQKKHPLRECEMNNIGLCNICELEHSIGQCMELLRLKVVLKESSEEVQYSYFITPRRPWQPLPLGMSQGFSSFNSWNNAYNAQQYPWKYSSFSDTISFTMEPVVPCSIYSISSISTISLES